MIEHTDEVFCVELFVNNSWQRVSIFFPARSTARAFVLAAFYSTPSRVVRYVVKDTTETA